MKFFNREKEMEYILHILNREPDDIYFIYGPINSGKTALINEIINNRLNKDKYVVFYFDLREIFISKYDDFIEVLFEEYEYDKKPTEVIKSLIKDIPSLYGIPIPKNTLEEILKKKTTKNVFRYITNVLMDIKKEGKQSIIIIDELQKIGDLKLNGFLIYELFNYFVSLTKHKHLCHVFCLSSDSLFIERVYSEAMLYGRCKYILVDDFDKETAIKFMDFLSEEILNKKLSDNEKELIYSYVGGKPKDIKYVVEESSIRNLKEVLKEMLRDEIQKLKYFLEDVEEEDKELYNKVVDALRLFKEAYEVEDIKIPKKIREFLVKKNVLFLNPQKGILKPQSYLVWNAIKGLL
ncbi:ATP-binding protein [Methanocaldococcus fervens]|uniref:ATPase n=1 Tax=Methanocaldococcus fervens (strain DSM 4213 / JCM 15782 / AG86) TaxID=573064 RepID=C7P718_METFA|nr:ATP-binding protein [Methanocaldococcus fervens]ACV24350.1 ATPase [Methanocaldococcus fervens AG86]